MKKIIYSALCLLATCAFFASCSDEVGDNSSEKMSATPAADIEGTYSGKWTASVKWVTDDPQAAVNSRTLFNGDLTGSVILKATEAYIANMTSIGQDVQGVDSLGNPATISILTGDANTLALQAKVNVMEQSGPIYTLTNQVANSVDSIGMITSGGIQGKIKDGELTTSFAKQVVKKGVATKMEVLNAAFGLCNTTSQKRYVVIIPTTVTTYNYTFTGKK